MSIPYSAITNQFPDSALDGTKYRPVNTLQVEGCAMKTKCELHECLCGYPGDICQVDQSFSHWAGKYACPYCCRIVTAEFCT